MDKIKEKAKELARDYIEVLKNDLSKDVLEEALLEMAKWLTSATKVKGKPLCKYRPPRALPRE